MLIIGEGKASFAKRAYMVCLFVFMFGAAFTMIVHNSPNPKRDN
jgi:hypothetical protein